MATLRRLRSLGVAAALSGTLGCGGGAPLLHPAHVLGEGRVSVGAGACGQFVFGKGAEAIDRSNGSGAGNETSAEQQFFETAVARTALAPGIAPWVGARAGLGHKNEGGLTYTGRSARADFRHAFGDDEVAISVGLGASAVLMHPSRRGVPSTQTTAGRFTGTTDSVAATGYGFDLPVVVGWRSAASIVEAWAGARGGVERVTGEADARAGGDDATATIIAFRKYVGGLAGAAIGFRPFSVALELDVAYGSVSATADFPGTAGTPSRDETNLRGITLAPSGAFIGKF